MKVLDHTNSQNDSLTLDQLNEKKFSIAGSKKQVEAKIAELGLSENRRKSKPHTINLHDLVLRDKLIKEVNSYDREIIDINRCLRKFAKYQDLFREVVKEILPEDVINMIMEEVKRRDKGEKPIKIDFNYKNLDGWQAHRQELRIALYEYHQTIVNTRREITNYIDLNCPDEYNAKIKFLAAISPVNKLVNVIDYYQKKRRILNY